MKYPQFLSLLFIYLLLCSQNTTAQDSIAITSEIKEIKINYQHKKQFTDHSTYTFNQEATEKARYAKDLLLTLPEIKLDPISNTLASIKGQRILFLINGIEATDNQIKSIRPTNVLRVEYFDIPPLRFAKRTDIVVNIVTKNPEIGYTYGTDLTSALTTGFVNGSSYLSFTNHKHEFLLDYQLYNRDYNNRLVQRHYDYRLNDTHYKSNETRKDHFGFTTQNIALKYTFSQPNKTVFQMQLKGNILHSFLTGTGLNTFHTNTTPSVHNTFTSKKTNYIQPILDLYFSTKITEQDELSANFVGSHFTTDTSEVAQEWQVVTETPIFDNQMNLKAKQTSLVGEIAYIHKFEIGKLSSGYTLNNHQISNDLHNLDGISTYRVNYFEQYLYSEYTGTIHSLNYSIGLGLTHIHNKSKYNTHNSWTFTPKLIINYPVTNKHQLRFTSTLNSNSPSSEELSSNIIQIAPNIVQKGNPFLKTSKQWGNNFIYSYTNTHFDLNLNLFYWYTNHAIYQYFALDTKDRYALIYENAKHTQSYGIQLSGSYQPFGTNLLTIQAIIKPASEKLKKMEGSSIQNYFISNYFSLTSVYRAFSIQYQFNIPFYTRDGSFLTTNENANHLFISYKHKNWTFTSGLYWIGMSAQYKTKSLSNSLVKYNSLTNIYNNKSMFIIGISYNFFSGKKNEINRTLHNHTDPAATF